MKSMEKTVSIAIFVMILSSSLALNSVSATHHDPDDAEEDLSPLFHTLNRTAEDMESCLDRAIDVNFTLDGNLSYDHYARELTQTEECALSIEEELSKPDSVLSEIEGEIGSDKFLEKYFVPLYGLSLNLTQYSTRHTYLISNMSGLIMQNQSERDDIAGDLEEAFNNTHDHLDAMEVNLENINKTVQEIEGDNINLTGLERSISKNEQLLEKYRDLLGEIGNELDLPPVLYISGPDIVYPGEEFQIKVSFFDGKKFNTSANITILLDGEAAEKEYVIEGKSYFFSYEVDWASQLWLELQVKAQVATNGVISEEMLVQIRPYPSSIELETEKEAYYDENITIKGVFETEAEIDLTGIELHSLDKKTSPSANGSFGFEFDSKEFRWGEAEVVVKYEGAENSTISSSSENVTFEVSIPTEIIITDYTETVRSENIRSFMVEGRLVNRSSQGDNLEGLSNRDLRVHLNGEIIEVIQTDQEGFFNFSFSTDDEIDIGQNVLRFSFEGSDMYRSEESREIQFEVVEEGSLWSNPLLMGGLALLIVLTLGSVYFISGTEEQEGAEERIESGREEDIASEISVPSAAGGEDITRAYRSFLEILEDMGLIELSKGKTHREIQSEINSHPQIDGLKNETMVITDLFEKALFTDRDISSSEIEEFNSSLSRLIKSVIS